MISLYILLKNVGEWRTNVESRDMLSSDETEPFDFKGDAEDHDDEYGEVSPKQNSLKETPEDTSLVKSEIPKENGHDHHGIIGNTINGNGIHEIHSENPHNYDDRDDEDEGQVNGEENHNDGVAAETNEDDSAPSVPYYGRTLVAPEYMNFQLKETSQKEGKTAEDGNEDEIAFADESLDQGSPRAEEETPDQAVQKEVLEEDDMTLSEEESDEDKDEDGNVEDEDQRVRVDFEVEEQHEEEEQEKEEKDEEDPEEEERKEEETIEGENSKHTPEIYCAGSPQLAQAEDDEEEDEEGNEYDEVQEGSSLKEEGEVEVEAEEQETTGGDGQHATQSKSSLQLAETDDDDEQDEEIDIESTNECNLKYSDTLKVEVASPALDIGEVGSVAESFDDRDGEGVTTEDNDGDKRDREEQEFTIEDRSFNETDDQHEEKRKTVRVYQVIKPLCEC